MSGDGKRGVAAWPKLPRPSSTLQECRSLGSSALPKRMARKYQFLTLTAPGCAQHLIFNFALSCPVESQILKRKSPGEPPKNVRLRRAWRSAPLWQPSVCHNPELLAVIRDRASIGAVGSTVAATFAQMPQLPKGQGGLRTQTRRRHWGDVPIAGATAG